MQLNKIQRARSERYEFTKFAALIDSPGNFATGITLPGSATLRVSSSLSVAATQAVTVRGTRHLGIKAAAAGTRHPLGRWAKGDAVKKRTGYGGTCKTISARCTSSHKVDPWLM